MTKQIIRHLLEHQGFVTIQQLSRLMQQPEPAIRQLLLQIDKTYRGMLLITGNETQSSCMQVKIANYADDIARKIVDGPDNLSGK